MQPKKKIWVDGCFDMFHYGHANALRQARELGDWLVVGVHNDAAITLHKGPPVMMASERYAAVAACKWADEVVPDAPYVTDLAIMDQYGCEVCVHGDDQVTCKDGGDVYQAVKQAGRFVQVKRTPSISTTELLDRMMKMKWAAVSSQSNSKNNSNNRVVSTQKIVQFASKRERGCGRVVYLDGTFDLVHIGHLLAMQQAKSKGDYLIIGIHDDETIFKITGKWPVMKLEERVLGVLACKWVDEVLIGAPFSPSKQFILKHQINLVVNGITSEWTPSFDPYHDAKEMGVFVELEGHSFSHITSNAIIERVLVRKVEYEERNARKVLRDAEMRSRGFV